MSRPGPDPLPPPGPVPPLRSNRRDGHRRFAPSRLAPVQTPPDGHRDSTEGPGRDRVDPAAAVPVADRAPAAARDVHPDMGGVDFAVVRGLRQVVAQRLADALRSRPVRSAPARRELGRSLIADAVARWAEDAARAGGSAPTQADEQVLAQAVFAALFGLGRLQGLVDDERIENIEANGCDRVWLSYADGREEPGPAVADSDEELIETLQFLAARAGQSERSFTTANPRLHLRLPDGSRLAAMAWTTPRPQVVIRRHRVRDVDVAGLVELGTVDTALAAFLAAAMRAGKNIVVCGLQNAGKTTLIRALASEFSGLERFATIEKEYELHLHHSPDRHPRVVAMEAREGNAERLIAGSPAGEVTVSQLVVDALRMNLRRIIVGEVRGDEALPMLEAMSTGDGSVCTVHARTARHALDRLVTLCLRADVGMSDTFAYRLAAGAVDLVVNIRLVDETHLGGGRHRFVDEVVEVAGIGEAARPALTTVFGPGPDGRGVPQHRPACLPELRRAGFDPGFLDLPAGTWDRPLTTLTPPDTPATSVISPPALTTPAASSGWDSSR